MQRQDALCLFRALSRAQEMAAAGERSAQAVRAEMARVIEHVPTARIEYAAVVEPENLEDADEIAPGVVAALAVRVGDTRLIDNMILNPGTKGGEAP